MHESLPAIPSQTLISCGFASMLILLLNNILFYLEKGLGKENLKKILSLQSKRNFLIDFPFFDRLIIKLFLEFQISHVWEMNPRLLYYISRLSYLRYRAARLMTTKEIPASSLNKSFFGYYNRYLIISAYVNICSEKVIVRRAALFNQTLSP